MGLSRRGKSVRNWLPHILFAVVVAAVLTFVFVREDDSVPDSGTTSLTTAVATSLATESATTAAILATGPTSTEAVTAVTTAGTSPPEEVAVLSPEASTYLEDLAAFKDTLQAMVADSSAANLAWGNTEETGVTFQETEEVLADVLQRARALQEAVGGQQVPPAVQAMHDGPDGPVALAGRLVALAEATLEGLRIPVPDDGSTRRAALADFIAAAEEFNRTVDGLIAHVQENADELGLMITVPAPDSTQPEQQTSEEATTTTRSVRQLVADTTAYTEALLGFSMLAHDLVATMTAANLAWDNTEETGVTYQETESALADVVERMRALRAAVRDYPVPDPLEERGHDVIGRAEGLVSLAEVVLEVFRSPASKDGSDRRDALAELSAAAEDFAESVDVVITYIEENAESLGLTDGT